MLKNNILTISIFCLSISIIIGSVIIAKSLNNNQNNNSEVDSRNTAIFSENMDINSAAAYLGISSSDLQKIINTEGIQFPYLKVGSDFIINKYALDKWLENARIEIK
ncbi:MAG: helix-turn-helix domain-containing protein [Tissierellia bacterium]|nr:helix-turn-helix domain-containing protein [Tissierellia bacterium]